MNLPYCYNEYTVLDGSCRSLEVLDGLAMKLTDWAELGGSNVRASIPLLSIFNSACWVGLSRGCKGPSGKKAEICAAWTGLFVYAGLEFDKDGMVVLT
nr:hypothetical protein Iba_chr02bCG15340 [Ipomoea batatas]